VTIIDSSVWIPLLAGREGDKVAQARKLIEGPEDIGMPGIIMEEVLRGIRRDADFRRIRDRFLADFDYLEAGSSTYLKSAEIYRTLRRRGRTLASPTDCLIAACALEQDAALLEDDSDFTTIARYFPLNLLRP